MTRVTRYLEVNNLELSCSGCFQARSSLLVHLSYCVVVFLLVMWSVLRLSLLQCLPVDSFLETPCLVGSGPGTAASRTVFLWVVLLPQVNLTPWPDMIMQITVWVWAFPHVFVMQLHKVRSWQKDLNNITKTCPAASEPLRSSKMKLCVLFACLVWVWEDLTVISPYWPLS